jgi:tRNA(Ile2) C34 agmatinyltransferase TiaS
MLTNIAQRRKAFKQPRKDRYCPHCGKRTVVDGDGVARCSCGWTANSKLVLPPKAKLIDPARELRRKA